MQEFPFWGTNSLSLDLFLFFWKLLIYQVVSAFGGINALVLPFLPWFIGAPERSSFVKFWQSLILKGRWVLRSWSAGGEHYSRLCDPDSIGVSRPPLFSFVQKRISLAWEVRKYRLYKNSSFCVRRILPAKRSFPYFPCVYLLFALLFPYGATCREPIKYACVVQW